MPNWPVRVTTTKRGLLDRVGEARLVEGTAETELDGWRSPAGADSEVDLSWGLARRDLLLSRRPTDDAKDSVVVVVELGEAEVAGAATVGDVCWLAARLGCSVCKGPERKRLEATRERSCDLARELAWALLCWFCCSSGD